MENKENRKTLELVLFFVLGIGVGIAFGISSVLVIRQNSKKVKTEYRYEITSLSTCEKEKLYYSKGNVDIYLYCLNSVKVKDGNNLLELKNYLKNNPNELEDMISKMNAIENFEDGGTTLYQDDGKLSKKGFTILKCATLEGSNDIYIGPKNMQFQEGFCQVEK